MQNALLVRLEGKLRANEMELSELRKLVDTCKKGGGSVGVSALLFPLDCTQPEKISSLRGVNYQLQKYEAVVLIKEDECCKARELLAEARKLVAEDRNKLRKSSSSSRKSKDSPTGSLRSRDPLIGSGSMIKSRDTLIGSSVSFSTTPFISEILKSRGFQ
jgi:hypothetical protein